MRLKGKVAVISGASRGIGAAVARGYVQEGCKVVVTYVARKEQGEQLTHEIGADLCMKMDVRKREDIRAVYEKTVERYGSLNILVNNAGINRTADFDKQTDEEWQDVIDVDLTGVFRCSQEVLPFISDYGRIINVGSLSGEYGGPGPPAMPQPRLQSWH